MKTKLSILVFFVSIFVFAGCENQNDLSGNWQIDSLIQDGVYQQIAVSDISFLMEDNQFFVAGNSGVNRFNGIVKVQGNKIIIENLASTRMMGSEEEMEYESLFLQTLTGVSTFKIKDNKLKIELLQEKLKLVYQTKFSELLPFLSFIINLYIL